MPRGQATPVRVASAHARAEPFLHIAGFPHNREAALGQRDAEPRDGDAPPAVAPARNVERVAEGDVEGSVGGHLRPQRIGDQFVCPFWPAPVVALFFDHDLGAGDLALVEIGDARGIKFGAVLMIRTAVSEVLRHHEVTEATQQRVVASVPARGRFGCRGSVCGRDREAGERRARRMQKPERQLQPVTELVAVVVDERPPADFLVLGDDIDGAVSAARRHLRDEPDTRGVALAERRAQTLAKLAVAARPIPLVGAVVHVGAGVADAPVVERGDLRDPGQMNAKADRLADGIDKEEFLWPLRHHLLHQFGRDAFDGVADAELHEGGHRADAVTEGQPHLRLVDQRLRSVVAIGNVGSVEAEHALDIKKAVQFALPRVGAAHEHDGTRRIAFGITRNRGPDRLFHEVGRDIETFAVGAARRVETQPRHLVEVAGALMADGLLQFVQIAALDRAFEQKIAHDVAVGAEVVAGPRIDIDAAVVEIVEAVELEHGEPRRPGTVGRSGEQ
ncbi:MAG: hypothetical protein ACOYLQ_18690 [Hyphomicrobiaceae bacterium]